MKALDEISMQYLQGATLINWIRLLIQNINKPVYWKSIPKIIYVTLIVILLTPIRILEWVLYNRKIKKVKIEKDPIFILGHWRSGTTFLVNMLSQDKQFGVTNAIHCFTPNIFLSCGKIMAFYIDKVMPKKRHMDMVVQDLESSQEEEFAIANMTTMSNYHIVTFPQNRYKYIKYAIFDGITEKENMSWKHKYQFFIKKVTLHQKGKQLLLKSPTNTSRIKQLLELYPNAKFINIYRNPYKVYLSTKNHYESFFPIFRLQKEVSQEDAQEFQMEIYEKMYKKYFIDRELIPKGNLYELKYEDFTKDPLFYMNNIYNDLRIDGYENAKSSMQEYLDTQKNYKTNKYSMDNVTAKKVSEIYNFTIKKWGYEFK